MPQSPKFTPSIVVADEPATAAAPARTTAPRDELSELLCAARRADEAAWSTLVARFDHVPRRVARSFRLTRDDVDDVVQASWLLLFEHIDRLREPQAIASWLSTTARRQALRLLQGPVREHLTDDPSLGDCCESTDLDDELWLEERRDALARSLATLPEHYRRLMVLLADESAPDYRQISATLAMPVGSIGAIRARSLARLERHPELRRVRACAS